MTRDYCTLFDRNFLFRGLALHDSLERFAGEYVLWILCMDDVVFDMLDRMGLAHVRLIRLAEFEDEQLLTAKQTRNPLEYCWTCTPSLPWYVLRAHPEIDSITYLDADLMFFSDPEPLFAELGEGSVAIIEHRFSRRWSHLIEQSGIYNVELLIFRNDERGRTVLEWWRDRCIEWCYDRVEDGKLADQMYLNDWPTRFEGVVVLQHPGAGLAPWNLERFEVTERDGRVLVDGQPLVFFHFSSFAITDENGPGFVPAYPEYRVSAENERLIYEPYEETILRSIDRVRSIDAEYAHGIRHISQDELADRRRSDRRARLIRAVDSVPPLRWIAHAVSGALRGRRGGP